MAGADFAECDVRLSRDSVPILAHDQTLHRTAGLGAKVADLDWDDLQTIDVGGWFSPCFAGETIPSLAAALSCMTASFGLVLELKDADMAPAVAEVIRREECDLGSLVFFSFYMKALRELDVLG